jgi:hypothetical protein
MSENDSRFVAQRLSKVVTLKVGVCEIYRGLMPLFLGWSQRTGNLPALGHMDNENGREDVRREDHRPGSIMENQARMRVEMILDPLSRFKEGSRGCEGLQ